MSMNNGISRELMTIFSNYIDPLTNGPRFSAGHGNIYTPQYIIQSPGFFSSNISGYEDAASCDIYALNSKRLTNSHLTSSLMGDGSICSTDAFVQMRMGEWGPKLDDSMKRGITIPFVNVIRISNIGNAVVPIIEFNHFFCTVQIYNFINDYINFYFKFNKIMTNYITYDQEGKKIGNSATIFDYTKVTNV